jgi:hypothetical protein
VLRFSPRHQRVIQGRFPEEEEGERAPERHRSPNALSATICTVSRVVGAFGLGGGRPQRRPTDDEQEERRQGRL